jgi:flavin reductase (DIM6/NTAB) family NADH-FMN oxidoreductase RutF
MKVEILSKIEKINYITPPSSTVLVSTISKDGLRNVAPFAQIMVSSSRPPILALGISPKSDTYRNICDTKQFVVGIPTKDILEQLVKAADKVDDEFAYVGFTPYPSDKVAPPKIRECSINIECELFSAQETGNHFIICGSVLAADCDEELEQFASDNVKMRTSFDAIYHIGNRDNFSIGFDEIIKTGQK